MHRPTDASLTPRFAVRGLFALILLVFSAPLCAAATLYVSPIGSDDNSGTIAAPYKTIRAAVNNASSGDTIYLAYAIYQGSGNRDIDFAGKSLSIVSQSGRGKAILDCQGTEQEPHRAFYFHSKEKDILLDGLTIKNTNMEGGVSIGQECTVKLHQCGFRDNTSGCVYNNGTATFIDCLFLSNPRNTCVQNGGTVTLSDCTFTGNSGGGVRNDGMATLTGCVFTGNGNNDGNSGNGGGVTNYRAATLTSCTFTGNLGGGLFSGIPANLTVIGCTFTGNTNKFVLSGTNTEGDTYGGAINIGASSAATIINCMLIGNTASYGGGISSSGTVTLTSCIVVGNTATAGNGGGVWNQSQIAIRFCSISDNIAKTATNQQTPVQGGGVENDGTAILTDDILWGNTAPNAAEIGTPANGNQTTTATYCDIQGGLSGAGNIKTNPGFVDAASGNLHLQASSPCRGAGITIGPAKPDPNQANNPNYKPDPGVSTDADGRHRPNPPSIGAYEYTANPPPAKKKPLLDVGGVDTGTASNIGTPADVVAPALGAAAVPTTGVVGVPPAAPQARPVLGPAEQKQANDEFLHLMVSLNTNTLSHDEMTRQIQGELAKGAQIDARDGEGFPAIVTAASLKRTDVVQVLLELGADPNALTVQVSSSDANANDDSSILHKTATGYQVNVGAVVSSIFGRKAKPKPVYGQSALMFAAQNGVADMVTLLLNGKVVVNMRDNRGKSALDYAADAHHDDVVATLKAHGAD